MGMVGCRTEVRLAALLMCGLLTLTGCSVLPHQGHGAVTYDLREAPTRADVRMPDGERAVIDEADESYTVTLLLPQGRRMETKVNLVTFDSYATGTRASTADPTGADMHTARIPLDEARTVMATSLRQLGTSDTAADRWVDRARSAGGTASVRSENVATRLGYLTVRVQGRYNPLDERASVAYSLSWGPANGAGGS
jgi:hypothetical protein